MIASIAFLALVTNAPVRAQQSDISFFVTSVGPGRGADLGGLEGADRHCQSLAQAAGAGRKTWHAYLSTQGPGAVNARDRIGKGPWNNAKGVVIAKDVAELHGNNNLNRKAAVNGGLPYLLFAYYESAKRGAYAHVFRRSPTSALDSRGDVLRAGRPSA